MTLRLLLVEDDSERVEKIRAWLPADVRLVWASCAGSALGLLRHDKGDAYAGVLLDFDLHRQLKVNDGHPRTGADVARRLVTSLSRDTPILVHSMNSAGRTQSTAILRDAGFEVSIIPMKFLTQERFGRWLEQMRANHRLRTAN